MRYYQQELAAGASMEINGPYGIAAIIGGSTACCALYALHGSAYTKIFSLSEERLSVVPSGTWGYFTVTNNTDSTSEFVLTILSHS